MVAAESQILSSCFSFFSGKGLVIAVHVWLLCWSLLEEFLSGLMDLKMLLFFYLIPGKRKA